MFSMVRNAKIMQLKGRQSVAKQLSSLYQASETKAFHIQETDQGCMHTGTFLQY